MAADAINLDEVVAIGYGIAKKSDLTGPDAVVAVCITYCSCLSTFYGYRYTWQCFITRVGMQTATTASGPKEEMFWSLLSWVW